LGTAAAGPEEPIVGIHEITDATDSDSTDSSDNDDSDGSNDELGDSGAIASSSAADGVEDPGADEPMESTADIPDVPLWDIRPDDSVRLSATRQMEEEGCRRCSSSSSEYSSL